MSDQAAARPGPDFTAAERDAVYKAIYRRRDIRVFLPDPVDDALLWRLLDAAHHAGSVGFMQPWNFLVVRDGAVKAALKAAVDRERRATACVFEADPARAEKFLSLKVEGIVEAPVLICVTSDPTREGPHVLGRNSDAATDLYSTACAIQNLWLAARVEGVAVGWVSIFRKGDVQEILGIPPHVNPIALLCIGYTPSFPAQPVLETVGWGRRYPLERLVYAERWGARWREHSAAEGG
ncbi:MAG: 5,6-dimethylbenzimidazole synthase [Thermaerobacter sp.]|jgi:5,6-dimethylbenzimidazole synthase|nr:5,6-dimethylbenzimidazole synthase [Thermaerobacter sp.]MDA8146226.1 5,6-dimethylbenzimidazole synthase [Thermaerobacter sp.]